MKRLLILAVIASLTACTAPGPAPVRDLPTRTATAPVPAPVARPAPPQIVPSINGLHRVERGDTLYAIAFANNLDYREVAVWNRLESPDRILVGQVLRLTPPPATVATQPLASPAPLAAQPLTEPLLVRTPQAVYEAYTEAGWARLSSTPVPSLAPEPAVPPPAPVAPAPAASAPPVTPAPPLNPAGTVNTWLWPADGVLAGRFGGAGGKGIDIVGPRNAPIRAVAPGRVVYSGSGLRGYGQLVIVKHDGEFLSAYAHNDSILVQEGESVAAGQTIARMGDSGAERVKLHFEIRRYGKPLDPLIYLPERS